MRARHSSTVLEETSPLAYWSDGHSRTRIAQGRMPEDRMPKQAKSSSAKSKSRARSAGVGESYEGGKHRPKDKESKNEGRARKR